MKQVTFQVQNRFIEFWNNLRTIDFKPSQIWINIIGWLLAVFLLSLPLGNNLLFLWQVLFCIFWYRLNKYIVTKTKPPIEILIILILIFYIIDYLLLSVNFSTQTNNIPLSIVPEFFHRFLIALQVLFFGLMLIRNNKDRQGVLVVYIIFGYIALQLISLDNIYYLYIFHFFIFLSLLKRTAWLESLTKLELWIYLIVFLFLINGFYQLTLYKNLIVNQIDQKTLSIFIPYYFHLLIKLYFLAILVKIPIVLIYNFAGLSRKLKISSLFQSTFPQLIQLAVLLFLFHSFISGWQSENLRKLFYSELEQIKTGNAPAQLTVIKKFYDETNISLQFDDYQPIKFSQQYPEVGIIILQKLKNPKEVDHFIYTKSTKTLLHDLYFVKLDTVFVRHMTENVNLMLNSGLLSYPYSMLNWQEFIYKFDLFDDINEVKIFPFGMVAKSKSWTIRSAIYAEDDVDKQPEIIVEEGFFNTPEFGVGRTVLSIVNPNQDQNSYVAFDIYYDLTSIKFGSIIATLLIVSIGLFFIINTFIIKRVTSFGTEINRIIIQKFEQLKNGIREISSGNLDYKVHLEGEDEFVELADHFNQMGGRLQKTIEEVREKDLLDYELKLARDVQLSLLATELPDIPNYQVAASLSTANMVGGDFYDLMQLDDHRFLFTIGDVSGKGTSAAFYMAQFLSLLRFTPQFTDKPVEIAVRMNDYFSDHVHDRQIFVTAIVGILDAKNHTIQFVRAGHSPPILIPGDKRRKLLEIALKGLGIGLTSSRELFKKSIEIKKMTLDPLDTLVLSSDGVVEAAKPSETVTESEQMDFYGDERFKNLLNELREKRPKTILEELSKDLDKFYANFPRIDDHTFLIIQRTGN